MATATVVASVVFLGSCMVMLVALVLGYRIGYREGWLAGTAEPPLPATDDAEVARMFGMDPGTREDGPWAR